jgi:CRISPR-associated protein Cmr1
MQSMRKLTVELETVTPLFLAGAEPRGVAELRAPSFRGAMRCWLRAIAGDQYKKIEADVFGDTQKAGQVSTQVRAHLEETDIKKYVSTGTRPNPTGHDYLFWSMGSMGSTDAHQYVREGKTLQVTLSSREDEMALKRASAALWLLIQLGGVGSRSRRTGGDMRVTKVDYQDEAIEDAKLVFMPTSNNAAAFTNELTIGIQQVRGLFPTVALPSHVPSPYDMLQPGCSHVWIVSDGWKTCTDAMNGIGSAFSQFRRELSISDRVVFGLPLKGVRVNVDRRASPLWLHVTKLAANSYVGVFTLFKSQFLPGNQVKEDYGLAESFAHSYEQCHEVTL